MPPVRESPYPGFSFLVEVDGVVTAAFSEVSGLGVTIDVVEYRSGGDPANTVRKLPGLHRYGNVTLKRGMTGDLALWQWVRSVLEGKVDRRAVAIVLLDEEHQQVLRFALRDAWPVRFEVPGLRAGSSDVAVEVLELAHEGLVIE